MNQVLFSINKSSTRGVARALLLCVFASAFFSLGVPRTTHAQAEASVAIVAVPVNDVPNTLKEGFWDAVAFGIAKIALNRLTLSMVEWIRSGFEDSGGPAFLTNPEEFFQDLGNQATGVFISELGLNEVLCRPWQFSVRLGLSITAPYRIKAQCTLLDAEANFEKMSENFMEKGWKGFFDITINHNNPYDAFLSAQSELAVRVGKKKEEQKFNLTIGTGYFPITKQGACLQDDPAGGECIKRAPSTTVTPGAYVANMVSGIGLSQVRQAELADELNEAIAIIAGELFLQAINPNRGLSDIDTVTLEEANDALAEHVSGSVGEPLATKIADTQSFIGTKNDSLSVITGEIYPAYLTLLGITHVEDDPGGLGVTSVAEVEGNDSCVSQLIASTPPLGVTTTTGKSTATHISDLQGINGQESAIQTNIATAGSHLVTLQGWQGEIDAGASISRLDEISSEISSPSFTSYDPSGANSENAGLATTKLSAESARDNCLGALLP